MSRKYGNYERTCWACDKSSSKDEDFKISACRLFSTAATFSERSVSCVIDWFCSSSISKLWISLIFFNSSLYDVSVRANASSLSAILSVIWKTKGRNNTHEYEKKIYDKEKRAVNQYLLQETKWNQWIKKCW